MTFPRTLIVDGARRVLESDADEVAVGTTLAAASWLGDPLLDAIRDAEKTGDATPRVACDFTRGSHFVVHATVTQREPWRAKVVVVDATAAVAADRMAVLGTLVHAMQNVSFALQSVLEAIDLDRPTGAALDEYLAHLRMPADKLSGTMSRLTACLHPPTPTKGEVTLGAVLDLALERLPPSKRPTRIDAADGGAEMRVSADAALLAECIGAMVESGADAVATSLRVDRVDVDGTPHARILVEREASPPELRAVTGLWDIAGGHRLDIPLRLTLARSIVLAHDGDVLAESTNAARVRLGFRVPLVSDG